MAIMAIQIIERNKMIAPLLDKSKKITKKVEKKVKKKIKKTDYKSVRGIEEFFFTAIMVCFALCCAGCIVFYVLHPLYRIYFG